MKIRRQFETDESWWICLSVNAIVLFLQAEALTSYSLGSVDASDGGSVGRREQLHHQSSGKNDLIIGNQPQAKTLFQLLMELQKTLSHPTCFRIYNGLSCQLSIITTCDLMFITPLELIWKIICRDKVNRKKSVE